MDNFIDRIAQKFSSQEVIKANLAAEAKETKRLREKIESYEELLTEMRQISLKNMESAEKIQQLIDEKLDAPAAEVNLDAVIEEIGKINDNLHTENVKVYRNVQAAVNNSLDAQTKKLLSEQQKTVLQLNTIKEADAKNRKKSTAVMVLNILILIGLVADIALTVINMLGIQLF